MMLTYMIGHDEIFEITLGGLLFKVRIMQFFSQGSIWSDKERHLNGKG